MKRIRGEEPKAKKRYGCLIFFFLAIILLAALVCFSFFYKDTISKIVFLFTKPSVNINSSKVIANNFSISGSIYFIKNKNIWVANGNSVRQLTSSQGIDQISVSKDGKIIIFSRIDTNYSNIYSLNTQSEITTQLTRTKLYPNLYNSVWNLDPILSSQQDKFAFLSDKSKFTQGNSDPSIFEMNLHTLQTTQISHSYSYTGGDQDPVYYPLDENYILYTKYTYLQGNQQPFSKLYLMDIRNKQSFTLSPDEAGILSPSFSHDGKYILFLKRDTTDIALNKNNSIYIMPFQLENILQSIPDAAFLKDFSFKEFIKSGINAMPVFSPDDKNIAYFTESNNDFNLATENISISMNDIGKLNIKTSNEQFITQNSSLTTISRMSWIQ